MPFALTTGSKLQCPHQGTVVLVASQTLLKIDGQPVLVDGDLDNAVISGCITAPSPVSNPCLQVSTVLGGKAEKLAVGGKAVLLDSAAGMTNGQVSSILQPWSVATAGQTKLQGT